MDNKVSTSSSNEYDRKNNFTIEILISSHGELQTVQKTEYGAKDLIMLESELDLCVFSMAAIGYKLTLKTKKEKKYRQSMVEQLEHVKTPNIDRHTFSDIIYESEKMAYTKRFDDPSILGITERSRTVYCSKTQPNKNYYFFDSKPNFIKFEFGIFILKTITFNDGFIIHANTNLLDMDEFKHFMKYEFSKYIEKFPENYGIVGYYITHNMTNPTLIQLSEIVSFFESLNDNKEISCLNILDRTCSDLQHGDARTSRRISRTEHQNKQRESFDKAMNILLEHEKQQKILRKIIREQEKIAKQTQEETLVQTKSDKERGRSPNRRTRSRNRRRRSRNKGSNEDRSRSRNKRSNEDRSRSRNRRNK